MQTVKAKLAAAFSKAIFAALGQQAEPEVVPTNDKRFGDYQANFAMKLARELSAKNQDKIAPRTVAEAVVAKLDTDSMAEEVSIAGPGFINIRLRPSWIAAQLCECGNDDRLGIEKTPDPKRVVLDYSAPNVAKEMHIGHLRPTNIGDALGRILEFAGHIIIRQNHVGDWGTQFGMLLRYMEESGDAELDLADIENFYRAAKQRFDAEPLFAEESRKMVVKLQSGDPQARQLWLLLLKQSRQAFEKIYRRMNIKLTPEDECGESFYNDRLAGIVEELLDIGIAQVDQEAVVTWTDGYTAPLIIRKRDGGYGYGTTDLAAVKYRIRELCADWLVYVTDARQTQHFNQFLDVASRAGWCAGVRIDHVTFGTILSEDGKPIKSRSGETIKLKDVLFEAEGRALKLVELKAAEHGTVKDKEGVARAVGIGAVKYFDLNRDSRNDYTFDWDQMLSLAGNTAPYMQYAYARIASIFRKAATMGKSLDYACLQLTQPTEIALAKHLLAFGEVHSLLVAELKPHYLCTYLFDLAVLFSSFYEQCPVLNSEARVCSGRLALCDLSARTIALGLDLLGIEHPDQL